jgi:septal ring factor EnvC (AmiA/AmiB activator)
VAGLFAYRTGLVLLWGLLMLGGPLAQAQETDSDSAPKATKDELKARRERILEEIRVTKKLLSQADEKQKKSLNYLALLDKRVSSRRNLISNYRQEVRLASQQISESNAVVEALENDLQRLKDNYAELVRYAYRNQHGRQWLVFLLSSESFYQALQRARYLRYYSEFRIRQLEVIRETAQSLENKITDLREQRNKKNRLLSQLGQEIKRLQEDRSEQAEALEQLRSRKNELQAELQEERRQAERLQNAIEDILAREMREKREAERRRTEAARREREQLAELSAGFASNKGRLPWPVKEGVVSSAYGRHAHPTLEGVEVNNNGIDITTEQDAAAYAVFSGEVISVFAIPGAGQGVLVRHGDYITVYSNLTEVYVTSGQQVKTRDQLGRISTNKQTGATELHFEVYHTTSSSTQKQNPTRWIRRL